MNAQDYREMARELARLESNEVRFSLPRAVAMLNNAAAVMEYCSQPYKSRDNWQRIAVNLERAAILAILTEPTP